MFRFLNFILLGLFLVWILPLGVFFDLTKEKLACDGQRAICLCKHRLLKPSGKSMMKVSADATQEKSNTPSSHHFLVIQKDHLLFSENTRWFDQSSFNYSLLVCHPIEHVPRT